MLPKSASVRVLPEKENQSENDRLKEGSEERREEGKKEEREGRKEREMGKKIKDWQI